MKKINITLSGAPPLPAKSQSSIKKGTEAFSYCIHKEQEKELYAIEDRAIKTGSKEWDKAYTAISGK